MPAAVVMDTVPLSAPLVQAFPFIHVSVDPDSVPVHCARLVFSQYVPSIHVKRVPAKVPKLPSERATMFLKSPLAQCYPVIRKAGAGERSNMTCSGNIAARSVVMTIWVLSSTPAAE